MSLYYAKLNKLDAMEREFRERHRSVQDIVLLWKHCTPRERKEMLRCLIDRIVVRRTAVAIDATIHWVDGATSPIKLWRLQGVRELVRRFHAEGMSAKQIRDRLAAGDPKTNQRWDYTVTHIYQILRILGLTPNSAKTALKKIRAEIDALYGLGTDVPVAAERAHPTGA